MVVSSVVVLATYLIQGVAALLLSLVLARLHTYYGHGYLRHWARSWAAFAVLVSATNIPLVASGSALHPLWLPVALAAVAAGYWQVAFLVFGVVEIVRQRPVAPATVRLVLASLVALSAGLVLPFAFDPGAVDLRLLLRIAVRSFVAGLALLAAGYALFVARALGGGVGRRLAGVGLVVYGFDYLQYAALTAGGLPRSLTYMLIVGLVDYVVLGVIGVGMVALMLEREREDAVRIAEASRRAEEELRRTRAHLEKAQQVAQVGSWEWDIATNTVTWSDELYRIFGRSRRDFRSTFEGYLECVHPEDRDRVKGIVKQACGDCQPFEFVARFVRPDGAVREEQAHGQVVADAAGRAVRMYGTAQDVTEARRTEAALQASASRYRGLFEHLLEGVFQSTREGRFLSVNPAFVRMLGYASQAELTGVDIPRDVYVRPEDRDLFLHDVEATGQVRHREVLLKRKDGQIVQALESARAVRDDHGQLLYYEGMVIDVTERRQLEDELRQAQKMEAVGRLAGGIAHAFNNLLMVIVGQSELLLKTLPADAPARRDVEEIRGAGRNAAALTRQLLAFGRKQVLQPVVVDLNAIVLRMESALRQLLGEQLEIDIVLDRELAAVRVDVGQIEQVVLNLVLNARDAMSDGGRITLRTANMPGSLSARGTSGSVLLEVRDSGVGMDEETRSRLFEPFFTTKERGKGTGLGLATVYGIVRQSGGTIEIESTIGSGSTFRVCLPAVDARPGLDVVAPQVPEDGRGCETVLLVEDETPVRGVVRSMLQQYGYTVLEARTPADAEQIARLHDGPIHLLLTDLVMPQVNGAALAGRLKAVRPAMKVVYMSGYAQPALQPGGPLDRGSPYLQKPFGPDALARKLRDTLLRA